MKKHSLLDCLLVWMNPYIRATDLNHTDEMCDQFWADYKWDGINGEVIRWVRGSDDCKSRYD